ncbi:hypothetical protein FKP32DRAFT_1588961, partial [Trametes sanguinea]
MRGLGNAIRFTVWIEDILCTFVELRVRANLNVVTACQTATGPLEIMMVCTALKARWCSRFSRGISSPAGFSSLQIGSHVHRVTWIAWMVVVTGQDSRPEL